MKPITPPCNACHPRGITRRAAVQAGAVGLLGLGMNHLTGLRALGAAATGARTAEGRAKSVIYIFLSGGLAQQDSFDMKPEAPLEIRGEFRPISTRTPGLQICELFPLLGEGRFVASALGVWAMVFLGLTIFATSRILGKKMGVLFRV